MSVAEILVPLFLLAVFVYLLVAYVRRVRKVARMRRERKRYKAAGAPRPPGVGRGTPEPLSRSTRYL